MLQNIEKRQKRFFKKWLNKSQKRQVSNKSVNFQFGVQILPFLNDPTHLRTNSMVNIKTYKNRKYRGIRT